MTLTVAKVRQLIFGLYTDYSRGYDLQRVGDTCCDEGKTTEVLIFGLYTDNSRRYDLERVTLAVAKVRRLRF